MIIKLRLIKITHLTGPLNVCMRYCANIPNMVQVYPSKRCISNLFQGTTLKARLSCRDPFFGKTLSFDDGLTLETYVSALESFKWLMDLINSTDETKLSVKRIASIINDFDIANTTVQRAILYHKP